MLRYSLALVVSFFVLTAIGQENRDKNSFKANDQALTVTLLGTGTPQPLIERFGPCILVQAGGQSLLFDAGRGCLQRLRQVDVSYDKINALFFTHLHSDHIVGLPDLWLTGWLVSHRKVPLNVFGPAGTSDMIKYLQMAYAFDIKIREEDDKATKEGSKLLVTEIQQGVVFDKDRVKVIAFAVDHFPVVPAFGYRIEYKGHSVVLSGDTRYSTNLIKFAKGTDLLIHEVVLDPDSISKSDPRYNIIAHHSTPEQTADVFNEVRPKLAAYSHIAKPFGGSEQEILKRAEAGYSGKIIIGEDLMSFSVDDKVSVSPRQKK